MDTAIIRNSSVFVPRRRRLLRSTHILERALEAEKRGYCFDRQKIGPGRRGVALNATAGQLAYEWKHLLGKLRVRSPGLHARWRREARPEPHPLFAIVAGGVESWERQRVRASNNRGGYRYTA